MRRLLPAVALLCLAPWTAWAGNPSESKSAPIKLFVDLSSASQRIYHARLEFPVQPGPLTLYYPKWIPGNHGPSGPIADLAGLKIKASSKDVPWRRDDIDMYAFHCTVPEGVGTLDVALDLLAAGRGGFGDATQNIAVLRWNQVALYPKGKPIDSIDFQASVKVPAGWKSSSALPIVSQKGDVTQYGVVDLETLVDSPVITGRYFREIPLGKGEPEHYLDLASDSAAGLEITPKQKAAYEKLVAEAVRPVRIAALQALPLPGHASATRCPITGSNTTNRATTAWANTPCRTMKAGKASPHCCRTSTSIRGTASSAARLAWSLPPIKKTTTLGSCGSTRD